MPTRTLPPQVLWAQKKQDVFLKICVEDCASPTVTVEKEKVYFKGVGGSEKRHYEVTIDLFAPIVPDKSATVVRDRIIEINLRKEEEGPYWPQLTRSKEKYHWLKFDFNKWEDEESGEEDQGQGYDIGDLLKTNVDKNTGEDRFSGESDSDDDEDLPDPELPPYRCCCMQATTKHT